MRPRLAIACVAMAAMAVPASAQDGFLSPLQAKQCSVWASYLSGNIPDEQTRQALLFATNYFTGYYEGATGQSIGATPDREAVIEVVLNIEQFTETCSTHMEGFAGRMAAWGDMLDEIATDPALAGVTAPPVETPAPPVIPGEGR